MASTPITRLRKALLQTDDSGPGIQRSSISMMSMYSSAPAAAAGEWKSCLSVCQLRQLLPLLYVANEVLQTSKRRHGTRFLESFSPLLPSAVRLICERDPLIVEKVRRTVKIWGDRRVFSTRFINEILTAVEDLRDASPAAPPPRVKALVSPSRMEAPVSSDEEDGSDFSESVRPEKSLDVKITVDDGPEIYGAPPEPERKREKEGVEENEATDYLLRPSKRRSMNRGNPAFKPFGMLSFNEMLAKLVDLDQQFKKSFVAVEAVPKHFYIKDDKAMQDIVGEELVKMNVDLSKAIRLITKQRTKIHETTKQTYKWEQEIPFHLAPMVAAIRKDDEQFHLCANLEEKLRWIKVVHAMSKESRDAKRERDARDVAEKAAHVKKVREDLARQKSLERAMKQPTGPNMRWNSRTKQYESVANHDDDDWRG
uniref:CID domain-containing protein n=1 Tax=Corethron hystrix TaxID=216773 RepID=A0A7S1FPG8_9STRA|mmetsp:Transcript_18240/g.41595  ORF Transcript_18240/g.41595 Transcript_18240/m.41595 type:complete len:426 (+) Transcript_18240:452-1729(+)|eukprot:CAMPEP_0113310798 /NCGR_PEP_ID=MMETSP0010_2-20120614/8298_1 /TAXON_ID=216773 ORGANISM="Corethron hystrix, Strain 308" /NCGR_SAMPLE_ID=MMETSP0010_2 /ASSEMBLY_ACC=CAM_ASM_000155 /LENGTH=425 /DNA_ID=CAMNT_0000166323 /DNA_START=366 /DNA_END=1643 /DNA_ORIENTATION=+ /assembly_acc=CAM_ASM_000155